MTVTAVDKDVSGRRIELLRKMGAAIAAYFSFATGLGALCQEFLSFIRMCPSFLRFLTGCSLSIALEIASSV